MSTGVRLATGEGSAFVAHVLALSALVALLTGSQALRVVVLNAFPPVHVGGAALLEASLLGEVDSLLSAWLVPVWLLTAAAAAVVTYDSARGFEDTSGLISELGASESLTSSLFIARAILLALVSFIVGLSLGLVATQVVFRVFLLTLGAQYFIPEVSPAGLGSVSLLSLSALFLGSAVSLVLARRRR